MSVRLYKVQWPPEEKVVEVHACDPQQAANMSLRHLHSAIFLLGEDVPKHDCPGEHYPKTVVVTDPDGNTTTLKVVSVWTPQYCAVEQP